MKGPWVKLWRSFLTDPTVQTLLKRYGHVTVTLLIALLTVTEDGIVVTPDDEVADLCGIDDKTYADLVEKIIAKGIIFRNVDGNIQFKNWNKYQECESAQRVRKFRERIVSGNVTVTLPKRECNENVTVRSKILEEEEDNNIIKDTKHKYGKEKNILLTDDQYQKLISDLGESMALACIEELSGYRAMKGYKCKRDDLAIKKWVVDAVNRKHPPAHSQASSAAIDKPVPKRKCESCGSTDLAPSWCRVCKWDFIQEPHQWFIDHPIEPKP